MLKFINNIDLKLQRKKLQFRKTIKESGTIEGIGLHSGENTRLTFYPAEAGQGILFYRGKNHEKNYLSVTVDNVIDTSLAVTIGKRKYFVQTIEHLMFALYILNITDIIIEIQGGNEIPILDGSAYPFLEILQQCEFHEFSTEVKPLIIKTPVMVSDGNRYIVGLPDKDLKISYSIDYAHPLLKNLSTQISYTDKLFMEHISRARTFGFMKDYEILKSRGLAQGGSTENVLVFTTEGTLNEQRYLNEALFHKILDMIGDLSIIGRPIVGHLLGSKGGHALDIAFAKKLLYTHSQSELDDSARFSIA